MVTATRLHSEFLRRVNRLNTSDKKSYEVYQIDSYLNEGMDIFYENRLSLLETNPQVRDDLRKAEVKSKCFDCKQSDDDNRICIVTLPDDYYRKTRHIVKAECKDDRNCGEKELNLQTAQSDDLTEILRDPFRKPSFEYETAWADEGIEGLYVYHNNAFQVNKVCIDYYKRLPRIAAPSLEPDKYYINSDGVKVEVDQGYILDTTESWRKVVDIAALIALRDTSAIQDFQTQLSKILQIDKINIQ